MCDSKFKMQRSRLRIKGERSDYDDDDENDE